jgi:dTDP-glucose 4,6-dehydratase/UDP-glucuronate decarboxylase
MVKPMSEILTTTENHTFTHTFHAASPASPNNFNEVQTLMFLNHDILPKLVEATSQFFVFFSTGEVYGTDAPPHVTEDYQGKVTSSKERASYPIAKLSGEQLLQQLAKDSEATIRVVRLFHTFGPGISEIDPRSFSAFLYQAVQNKSILLSSQGTQIRTFLHLADTTRALTAIMQTKMLVESEPINLGSSNPISIYDFASLVAKFTESKIVMNWSSDFEQSPNNILIPDTNKLMGLGWKEQIGTADAIQDVLAWLKLSDQEKQF